MPTETASPPEPDPPSGPPTIQHERDGLARALGPPDDLLGEGGMGQVWQATDTQLNREVALKILPDAFATDPERLESLNRE